MTVTEVPEPPPPAAESGARYFGGGVDRGLAMVGYVCLFLTIFFAGASALAALVLAYIRQGGADPVSRAHYRFQIALFWWAFGLTVVAAIALTAAAAAGLVTVADPTRGGSIGWWLLAVSALLFGVAALVTWIGPLVGGIKLALGRPLGKV